jgi:hypothetical protein
MKINFAFSRRGPDRIAEELATVLKRKTSFAFKDLFLIVHDNLRARNAANCGEEMLRLRAYEKLQNLVQAGLVKKTGKEYLGIPAALVTFLETAADLNAKFAAGLHCQPPATSVAAPTLPLKTKAKLPRTTAPKAKSKSRALSQPMAMTGRRSS